MITRTALAAAGLLALAACTATPAPTSTTSAAPSGTTSAAPPAGLSCDKAPEDVVGAALSLRLSHPRQTVDGDTVTCSYDGGGAVTSVVFRSKVDATGFAKGKLDYENKKQKVTDLTGLGDEAYATTLGTGEVVQHTVVARKGSTEVAVTSGANQEQERKLVATLLEGL
ncbi:hypothetical protein [Actinosynnema sp. NPDC020468]|uniref:hypothetical protein n=1 Tax=Actinosynnema sp. NPDC020468 TaxID=3154488 RepID=UPI0033D73ED0